MGNQNSGRWGGAATVERTGAMRLDVNDVMRAMRDQTGSWQGWYWSLGGSRVMVALTVKLHPSSGGGTVGILHDAFEHLTAEVPAASYPVDLTSEPCRYGGRRWYFLCPCTGRRVAKLYLPNGGHQFWSRQAYRLGYQSQRVTPLDRAHAHLARLHRKLDADYHSPLGSVPPRPKGMRRATYKRLLAERDAGLERLDRVWLAGAGRWLQLIETS